MPNTLQQTNQPSTVSTQSRSSRPSKMSTNGTSKPRGKSRYSQKARSKKNVKPVAPKRGPVNEYISACCSAPARKPACGEKTGEGKVKEVKGLGHFRCSQCGKGTKVTARKPQPKVESIITVEVPVEPAA